jgi:hypothetical protein
MTVPNIPRNEVPLILLARNLFSYRSGTGRRLVNKDCKLPKKLSRATLDLLRDDLRKAIVSDWARRGHDPLRRGIYRDEVRQGAVWRRFDAPGFQATPFVLRLFRWLLNKRFDRPRWPALKHRPGNVFDEFIQLAVVLYLQRYGRLTPTTRLPAGFADNPLIALLFPDIISRDPEQEPAPGLFDRYQTPDGTLVLDLLQALIAEHLARVELHKMTIAPAAEMITLGRFQNAVLGQYLQTIERLDRPDLGRCVVDAALGLAEPLTRVDDWSSALSDYRSMSALYQARQQAVSFCGHLDRLAQWVNRARSVAFFDPGYDRAQLLLSVWQPLGDSGHRRFQDWSAAMLALSNRV